MTRVRVSLFASLDGYTAAPNSASDNPMGEDWGPLTAAYAATRTVQRTLFGDTSGAGTTGVDDAYATKYLAGVGAEIMGAGMFGLHTHPDDPDWKGWWGDQPPFGYPVFVLTHTAPRPAITMAGGTVFEFRSGAIDIQWLERNLASITAAPAPASVEQLAAVAAALLAERSRSAPRRSAAASGASSDSEWTRLGRLEGMR